MELEMEWTRWENGSLVFPAGLTSWTETFECAFLFSARPAPSVRHRRRYRRRLSVRARGQTHARTDTLSPGGGGAFLFEFFFWLFGFLRPRNEFFFLLFDRRRLWIVPSPTLLANDGAAIHVPRARRVCCAKRNKNKKEKKTTTTKKTNKP